MEILSRQLTPESGSSWSESQHRVVSPSVFSESTIYSAVIDSYSYGWKGIARVSISEGVNYNS